MCKTFGRDEATLARGSFACHPRGRRPLERLRAVRQPGAHRAIGRGAERRAVRDCSCGSGATSTPPRPHARLADGRRARRPRLRRARSRSRGSRSAPRGRRQGRNGRRRARRPWLRTVRELLHDRVPQTMSLHELGDVVGRRPAHVARAFRREHGVTVAQYVRALRLEWAAAELAGETPRWRGSRSRRASRTRATSPARSASHHGVTPGRYRRLVRASLALSRCEPAGSLARRGTGTAPPGWSTQYCSAAPAGPAPSVDDMSGGAPAPSP